MTKAMIEVNNVNEAKSQKPLWVVNIRNGEAWFCGAFEKCSEAHTKALEVDGLVVENPFFEENDCRICERWLTCSNGARGHSVEVSYGFGGDECSE